MLISDIKIGERFRKDVGDLSSLTQSIKEVGLLHPVVVSENNELIAGVRRLKAVKLLGWTEIPATVVNLADFKCGERDENEVRLNLNPTEAVDVKRYFTPIEKENTTKGRPKKGGKLSAFSGEVRVKVARKTGYSAKTLEKAEAVVEAAEKEPEKYLKLQIEMNQGKRNVNSAFTQLKEAKRKEEINEKLKEGNLLIPDEITLIQGDFANADIKPESIQLILTDPPYPEEYLPLWDQLADFAEKVLVKGGFLVAYCGHYHLPVVLDKLRGKLNYFWVLSLIQKQNAIVQSRHVYCHWKPLVVFYKPPLTLPAFFDDVINGKGREKDRHEWQQGLSELEPIIKAFCPENGLILDPCAGSGTTLLAAKKLGRKSIGIEANSDTFKTLKLRVCEK